MASPARPIGTRLGQDRDVAELAQPVFERCKVIVEEHVLFGSNTVDECDVHRVGAGCGLKFIELPGMPIP